MAVSERESVCVRTGVGGREGDREREGDQQQRGKSSERITKVLASASEGCSLKKKQREPYHPLRCASRRISSRVHGATCPSSMEREAALVSGRFDSTLARRTTPRMRPPERSSNAPPLLCLSSTILGDSDSDPPSPTDTKNCSSPRCPPDLSSGHRARLLLSEPDGRGLLGWVKQVQGRADLEGASGRA